VPLIFTGNPPFFPLRMTSGQMYSGISGIDESVKCSAVSISPHSGAGRPSHIQPPDAPPIFPILPVTACNTIAIRIASSPPRFLCMDRPGISATGFVRPYRSASFFIVSALVPQICSAQAGVLI